jgi:hypothetical protein
MSQSHPVITGGDIFDLPKFYSISSVIMMDHLDYAAAFGHPVRDLACLDVLRQSLPECLLDKADANGVDCVGPCARLD